MSARNAYQGDLYHQVCARLESLEADVLALTGQKRHQSERLGSQRPVRS